MVEKSYVGYSQENCQIILISSEEFNLGTVIEVVLVNFHEVIVILVKLAFLHL